MSDYYAAKQCQLKLFGNTVKSILEANDLRDRDLDVVELWSGVGSIVKAAQTHAAVPFDINRRPGVTDVEGPGNEDITSPAGFNKALDYVLRLRPSGLLFMAPVCSSFSFCNMHNTKRNRDNVRGDESYAPVQKGNLMADIAGFFLCVALARKVHTVIENPVGSLIFSHLAPITNLFGTLEFATADRCAYVNKKPGEVTYKKPYKFLVSGRWLRDRLRKCTCVGRQHAPLMVKNEKGQISGRAQCLTESAAYPRALGEAIVAAWEWNSFPRVVHNAPDESDVKESDRPSKIRRTTRSSGVDDPWDAVGHSDDGADGADETADNYLANKDDELEIGGDPWRAVAESPTGDTPWAE